MYNFLTVTQAIIARYWPLYNSLETLSSKPFTPSETKPPLPASQSPHRSWPFLQDIPWRGYPENHWINWVYLCDQRERVSESGCTGNQSIRCFCYRWRRDGKPQSLSQPWVHGTNPDDLLCPVYRRWKGQKTIVIPGRRRIWLFLFVTNTKLLSEEVVSFYEKRGNCENYIKEAKYDMAVGHLLLQSFWANEAIFQLTMIAYNLFLLFKMDFTKGTEYRQRIKIFRLKYVLLAGKIIRTARRVVMKLSAKYPYQDEYETKFFLKNHPFSCLNPSFVFNSGQEKSVPMSKFVQRLIKEKIMYHLNNWGRMWGVQGYYLKEGRFWGWISSFHSKKRSWPLQ